MKTLFLDDDETRQSIFFRNWLKFKKDGDVLVQTRTVEETIDALKTQGPFDLVDLDHDLGGKTFVKEIEGTGYQVALFIETELDASLMPKHAIVHSYNPEGARRMMESLAKKITSVQFIPFGSKKDPGSELYTIEIN